MFSDQIVAMIRAASPDMEREGRLKQEVLDFIYEQQLFKFFVPEELGGRLCTLPEALRIFEQAAWIDSSFGWLVTVGAGGGFFTPFMQPAVSQVLLTPRDAVIAGSGFPAGIAQRVEGGYIVQGRWKYCSGSTYATLFTANCYVKAGLQDDTGQGKNTENTHAIRSFILKPSQVKIIQDWDAYGMKATGSHSIEVEACFIHEDHTFSIMEEPLAYPHLIYQFPFLQFSEASFTAVVIGMVRHFFDEARDLTEAGREGWSQSQLERYPAVWKQIKNEEKKLKKVIIAFFAGIDEAWTSFTKQKVLSNEEQLHFSHLCKATTRTAVQAVEAVFPYLGMSAVMEGTTLNRIWRDLHTASQHVFLAPYPV